MFKVNGSPIEVTMFPDRTSQVWKLPEELFLLQTINIEWYFDHEGEVMHLVQLVDLFRSRGPRIINLYIDYLPYARQDKQVGNNSTFALASFAKILDSMQLDKVDILDMHSDKLQKYTKNVPINNIEPYKFIKKAAEFSKATMLYCPDLGAYKRYDVLSFDEDLISGYLIGYATKYRNQFTGEITGMFLQKNISVKDQIVLIVDDICDGGKTFTELANLLYTNGAKEVNLYVTHGIFSKGLSPLFEAGIKRIFTKNGEAFELQNNIVYKEY